MKVHKGWITITVGFFNPQESITKVLGLLELQPHIILLWRVAVTLAYGDVHGRGLRTKLHHKTQVTKTILIIAVRTQMCFQRWYPIFLGGKDLIMEQQLLSFKNSPQIEQNSSLLLTKKQTSQQSVLDFSRCPVGTHEKKVFCFIVAKMET